MRFRSHLFGTHGRSVLRAVRPAPLAATIGIHVAVIALVLIPQARPAATQKSAAIAVFDVPPAPTSEAPRAAQLVPVPATPPAPLVVPPLTVPTTSDMVVALETQADLDPTGGACDLTRPVQEALLASDPVREGLDRIPRAGRSVANAIMVWNADWIVGDAPLDQAALGVIRDVVAGTIAVASVDCRLQPQGGPRLLILPGATENVVLALGSGKWRWQDLLDTATRPPGTAMDGTDISVSAGGARASITLR